MTNNDIKEHREDLCKEWDKMIFSGKIPMFELEVINKSDMSNDYLIINISIDAKTAEISCDFNLADEFETEIDDSLDSNLDNLLEAIITDKNFTNEYFYGHED